MVTQLKPETDSPVKTGSKGHLVETLISPLVAVYNLMIPMDMALVTASVRWLTSSFWKMLAM